MIIGLKALFSGFRRAKDPLPPDTFVAHGPPAHDPEVTVQEIAAPGPREDSAFHGAVFLIRYEDAENRESDRRVKISQVKRIGNEGYLQCYCYERRAPRLFKIANLDFICDVETGEILSENPRDFFKQAVKETAHVRQRGASHYKEAFAELGPGIRALVYLARVDGHFHTEELETIRLYAKVVRARWNRKWPYDEAAFMEYARRQYPGYDDFVRDVNRLVERDLDVTAFLKAAAAVLAADGIVTDEEFLSSQELDDLIEEAERKAGHYHV